MFTMRHVHKFVVENFGGHVIRAVIMTHQLYQAEARIGFVSNNCSYLKIPYTYIAIQRSVYIYVFNYMCTLSQYQHLWQLDTKISACVAI